MPIGEQPHDIEAKIRGLILDYIKKPNSIILALTAANTDLANSDALKLAREVDPEGNRTIGVVTKLDLMDKGTDAVEMLTGRIYPLKLGYIGVVCRSQKDIIENKQIQEALKSEQEFFAQHPQYAAISDNQGIHFLSKTLNTVLITHIKNCLPAIKNAIQGMIHQKEVELLTYGTDLPDDDNAKGALLLNLIGVFSKYYSDMIEGLCVKETSTEYLGGARISHIFNEIFCRTILTMDPFDNLSDDDIRTAIKNAKGLRPNLFVPEAAFEILVKQQIARIQSPAIQCLQMIFEELRTIILNTSLPELVRFNRLQMAICEVMDTVLAKCITPTQAMIDNLIKIEEAYINTCHPDFLGGTNAIINLFKVQQDNGTKNSKFSNYLDSPDNPELVKFCHVESKHDKTFDDPSPQGTLENEEEEKEPKTEDKSSWRFIPFLGKRSQKHKPPHKTSSDGENDSHTGIKQQLSQFTLLDWEQEQLSKKHALGPDALWKLPEGLNMPNMHTMNRLNDLNIKNPPTKLPEIPSSMRSHSKPSSREVMETELIKNLIVSYFNVVRKNVCDSVPKSIMCFLVNESKNIAHRELVRSLYSPESIQTLVQENPIIAQNRKLVKKVLLTLRDAINVLNLIRDSSYNSF